MRTLRTKETDHKYEQYRRERSTSTDCVLCPEPSIIEFKYWRIIENKFPYDLIAETHNMIITKRHTSEDDLNIEEKEEWESLKKEFISDKYQFIVEATKKQKSVPGHFHFHLIVAKEQNYE